VIEPTWHTDTANGVAFVTTNRGKSVTVRVCNSAEDGKGREAGDSVSGVAKYVGGAVVIFVRCGGDSDDEAAAAAAAAVMAGADIHSGDIGSIGFFLVDDSGVVVGDVSEAKGANDGDGGGSDAEDSRRGRRGDDDDDNDADDDMVDGDVDIVDDDGDIGDDADTNDVVVLVVVVVVVFVVGGGGDNSEARVCCGNVATTPICAAIST
jgi:hypothetical protein